MPFSLESLCILINWTLCTKYLFLPLSSQKSPSKSYEKFSSFWESFFEPSHSYRLLSLASRPTSDTSTIIPIFCTIIIYKSIPCSSRTGLCFTHLNVSRAANKYLKCDMILQMFTRNVTGKISQVWCLEYECENTNYAVENNRSGTEMAQKYGCGIDLDH